MTFASFNLDNRILKAISSCGYKTPTPVQHQAIPAILNGQDIIASAQTGTGKTAAFVLPALHKLTLTKKAKNPRVLILTPTRELANQILDSSSKYGKFLQSKILSVVGGVSYQPQIHGLSKPLDIIVATPGRLLDHMERRRVNLSSIEMLILDEADRMLDMGFLDDVMTIAKATPSNRQTLLFSATFDKQLKQTIAKLLKNPTQVEIKQETISPKAIQQEIYYTDHVQHKNALLKHLLVEQQIFKAIIFTATKISADTLGSHLNKLNLSAGILHGDLKQNVRNRTIDKFRRGKFQFLVATDVAARGLDVNDITHVINYDLPKFCEDYIHRIGRTGRAGKKGCAISFVSPHDEKHVKRIERFINQTLSVKVIAGLEAKRPAAKKPQQKKRKFKNKKERKRSKRY